MNKQEIIFWDAMKHVEPPHVALRMVLEQLVIDDYEIIQVVPTKYKESNGGLFSLSKGTTYMSNAIIIYKGI